MIAELKGQDKLPLKAALGLARRGWRVFPTAHIIDGRCSCGRREDCDDAGKHPLTANGLRDATADPGKVNKWWGNVPDANVAVATGAASGVWVLDADGEAGVQEVAELEARYGRLPRTVTVRTGGGGRHYYFAWPAGHAPANAVKLCGLPVDVRGEGGYAIVPPSRHASGNDYAWEVSPDEAEPAQAPEWLLRMVASKRLPEIESSRPTLKLKVDAGYDLETEPGVAEGSRHNTALQLIGAHLGRGEDQAEVTAKALLWAARCDPPMPEQEVRRIVADLADRQQQQRPRQEEEAAWEPPARFNDFDLPPFPAEVFPGWLRDYVEAEAVATQTPSDLAAMLTLATLA